MIWYYQKSNMPKWKDFTNKGVSRLLRQVAAAYEIKDEDRFRVAAYDRAATSIEHATSEVKDLWDDGELDEIPGVGKSIASHLDELFRTGRVKHFEKLFKTLPPAMFEFLALPGMGAKTAYKLVKELRIKDPKTALDQLEKAAKQGEISPIASFGEKSQERILEAIRARRKGESRQERMNLPYADEIAREVLGFLEKCPSCVRADSLGSLRRRAATIGDIDLSVSTRKPREAVEFFVKFPKKEKLVEKGSEGASIRLTNKRQIDLRVQEPEAYGAMLQHFTGSKQHNIHLRELALKKGLSLSEHGIKRLKKGKVKEFASEEEFYKALGMEFIPPELREDTGEIEAAQKGKLPKLIELEDIKGDLHLHSSFDIEPSHDEGRSPMEEMVRLAKKLGYEYVAFTEHNPSTSQHKANEIVKILKRKRENVEKISKLVSEDINYSSVKKLPIFVFNSLEIDIKPNGDLAIPKEGMKTLDFAIVSIHTSFSMKRDEMTKRVLSGLSHPKAKILGHPTGRKINMREGYELSWDKVFDFCLKNKKWLEINAWPDRLDLPDTLVREAVERGVKLVISTDAHELSQMNLMTYGVSVARRGWAEKKNIVNTLGYNKLIKLLKEGR